MVRADTAPRTDLPQVAILFEQYAAYHVDRVEAAARRLAGRASVVAVEYATSSQTYAWEPAEGFSAAQHQVLFPGRSYDSLTFTERFRAGLAATSAADWVFTGVPYSRSDQIALSWRLAATGRRMVMMTDSKFDDMPRRLPREVAKARILSSYRAAVVAGTRQRDYLSFLGFGDKPVLPGYDTVGLERLRAQTSPTPTKWGDRRFIFVGRFVAKKNLATLVEGYARYVTLAGDTARGLQLVGDGELSEALRVQVQTLGIAEKVEFTGFLTAPEVAQQLSQALALCLVSTEEQWGLVVNEAAAFGVPALVSHAVGARDALVRNALTGFVVEPQSADSIAQAMVLLARDEADWQSYSDATAARAHLGDTERFADAIEALVFPGPRSDEAIAALWKAIEEQ